MKKVLKILWYIFLIVYAYYIIRYLMNNSIIIDIKLIFENILWYIKGLQ